MEGGKARDAVTVLFLAVKSVSFLELFSVMNYNNSKSYNVLDISI